MKTEADKSLIGSHERTSLQPNQKPPHHENEISQPTPDMSLAGSSRNKGNQTSENIPLVQ